MSQSEINRQIIKLIGQSVSPTILGLLPVEVEMQDACLKEVRNYVAGDFCRLKENFGNFPATTAYAVALSIGRGVTDANFYNAIRDQLGLELNIRERGSLAVDFTLVCLRLGVVMPPDDQEAAMDRNLRQIIFQAGILPYWVEHLGPAVTGYLERNACPDLEDAVRVVRFAIVLSEKVPEGHARLRRTLKSNVGPLVTAAILRAFSTGDFDQLPPHLRAPMREARRRTGAESIRSPVLRYRRESRELVLVLPRQSSKLADYNSHYRVGSTTFNALVERELAASDLGSESIAVQLCDLRAPYYDQTFQVKLEPNLGEPFFIFRATDGRRVIVGEHANIELPLGDYNLLLGDGVTTNEVISFERAGNHRVVRIEVFPGREPLELNSGERTFTVCPRLGSDLLIQDRAGNRLGTIEGGILYYGDSLEVHAFTPAVAGDATEPVEFKIECLKSTGITPKTYRAEQPSQRGAYEFYDLTQALARPFFTSLQPGIYEVQISAEGKTRTFSRRLTYWKGFTNTSSTFGFCCTEPPTNFDAGTSAGLRSTPTGLRLSPDHIGAEVVLGVRQPSQSFTLAKPGLWLALSDPSQHELRPLTLGASVEVSPTLGQVLVVESGDVLPWQITCQETLVVTLKPGQARSLLNLSALLAQFGESGLLQATNPAGSKVELVTFSKANLIRDLRVDCPNGSITYAASFKLGKSQIRQLEVTVTNFADGDLPARRHEIDLADSIVLEMGLGEGQAEWQIVTEGTDWVITLRANLTAILPGVHFVDLRGRPGPDDAWQSLKVADMYGLSESRLVFGGPSMVAPASDWTKLVSSVYGAFHNGSPLNLNWLTPSQQEMSTALDRLQEALLFKYASTVWPSVRWLENAVSAICQHCFDDRVDGLPGIFASAAVAGLERRSKSGLNINSILIFGCQSRLLSLNGAKYCPAPSPNTPIARVFSELGRIAAAPRLRDYAMNGGQLDFQFLGSFGNFAAVASNLATEFGGFNYQEFFKHLGTAVQDLDFRHAHTPFDRLLSPAHFLGAIRPLNRRFRPLEQERSQNETTNSLSRMVGDIQAASRQFDQVALELKERLEIPGYVDFRVPVKIAESEMVQVVSDLLLLISAIARLRAADMISRKQYTALLKKLLTPEGDHLERRIRRFCLLLSLAPELFAFYMLFWEAVLKPLANNERH